MTSKNTELVTATTLILRASESSSTAKVLESGMLVLMKLLAILKISGAKKRILLRSQRPAACIILEIEVKKKERNYLFSSWFLDSIV